MPNEGTSSAVAKSIGEKAIVPQIDSAWFSFHRGTSRPAPPGRREIQLGSLFKTANPMISPLSLMEHADSRYKAVS